MADVRPFRGLRYHFGLLGDLASVLAPPYDIITPEEQWDLYERSPWNVVRLEYGLQHPADSSQDNRYTRATVTLAQWLREGILRREERPAFYLCRHSFSCGGRRYIRRELIARVRLEGPGQGVVRPHEHTLAEPKADRLRLLRACQANLSPVYALYREPAGRVGEAVLLQEERPPTLETAYSPGEGLALWVITDPTVLEAVASALTAAPLYIADGHHRYETALSYQAEMLVAQPNAPEDAAFNFVMMALTDCHDPGLLILPLHRLVQRLPQERLMALPAGLERDFQIQRLPLRRASQAQDVEHALDAMAKAREETPALGLYGLEPEQVLVLRPRRLASLRQGMPAPWSETLRKLDVSLLHHAILERMLGIGTEEVQRETSLEFTPKAEEAIAQVDRGSAQLALLLNPTRVEQVMEVADRGEKMPQKSTYFFPKLPTGLVLSVLKELNS